MEMETFGELRSIRRNLDQLVRQLNAGAYDGAERGPSPEQLLGVLEALRGSVDSVTVKLLTATAEGKPKREVS